MLIADKYSFYNLLHVCLDDGKLKMEVTGTTMATGGEAKGQVTCKVIVGKCNVCDVMSRHVMSCHVLSCPVLSYPVLSCSITLLFVIQDDHSLYFIMCCHLF